MGTDLGSLVLAALRSDSDPVTSETANQTSFFSLDFFVPLIASFDVVPDYFSFHATARPQLWLLALSDTTGPQASFISSVAGGARIGKNYGVHLEGAPLWTTASGLGWTAAAQIFFRLPARSDD
jgi:hypothetical protein